MSQVYEAASELFATSADEKAQYSIVDLKDVPEGCFEPQVKAGRLESITYLIDDYAQGFGRVVDKAVVYLPFGYDAADDATHYPVLYLLHGRGGDETTWLGSPEEPTLLVNLFDHMIANGECAPFIAVAPNALQEVEMESAEFVEFPKRLFEDCAIVVARRYHTCASEATIAGLHASRGRRIVAGFSLGGSLGWKVLCNGGMDYALNYLLMSSGCWEVQKHGGSSAPGETARLIADRVLAAADGSAALHLFCATGTNDNAAREMRPMLDAMVKCTDAFTVTEGGFADGNLRIHIADGYIHDYIFCYDYLYRALPVLLRDMGEMEE